ncbi:hypothetical protein AgCh_021930 [Apium graveolens]
MYSLLQQRQRDIEFRESASEQRQRVREAAGRIPFSYERLNQVVMEKKKQSRSGMEIMNLLQVDAYESKNQELVAENADLRALLRSMQPDIIAPGVAGLAAFSPAVSPSDDIKYDKDL